MLTRKILMPQESHRLRQLREEQLLSNTSRLSLPVTGIKEAQGLALVLVPMTVVCLALVYLAEVGVSAYSMIR